MSRLIHNAKYRGIATVAIMMLALACVETPGPGSPANAQGVAAEQVSYVVTRGTAQGSMPIPQRDNSNIDAHGFRFFCVPTHFSYDDPVVYPGRPGATHLHMYFGNTDVDAFSTRESVINSGRSSCDGGITNRSAYWVPALYNADGEVVLPDTITNYYKSWVSDRSKIRPIPQGLQILANDQVPGSAGVAVSKEGAGTWQASIRVSEHDGLTISILFPDCVAVDQNGDPILASPGGTRHVAYSSGACPPSHPYTIPQLTQNLNYSGVPFDSDWHLSSDRMFNAPKGTTAHADYIAGWTIEAAQIMADCVRAAYRECGPRMHGFSNEQFQAPDGQRVYDGFKVNDATPAALRGWPAMVHHQN